MQSYHLSRQMNLIQLFLKLIIVGVFVFIMTACSGDTTPDALPTLVEFPTDQANEVTPEQQLIVVTDEPGQTPEVQQPVGVQATESIRYQTEDGTLFVVVTSVFTAETMPNMPVAPDGEQFIMLTTNLANFTGEEIMVEASSLTLIDENLNRYAPIVPDDFLRSPVFGITLGGATTAIGSVRFAIPTDAIPYLLEWCPYNDCEVETLQTLLP